jgi:hypothetical protein
MSSHEILPRRKKMQASRLLPKMEQSLILKEVRQLVDSEDWSEGHPPRGCDTPQCPPEVK